MRTKLSVEDLGNALSQPWLAILAVRRPDDTVMLSPMWFEWSAPAFLIGLVKGDYKERYVRQNPYVGVCVAEEATYPGRCCEAWGYAKIAPDPEGTVMRRIAARYLGPTLADTWVDQFENFEWETMRLEPERFRAIDHRDETMLLAAEPAYLPEPERTPVG